jgi:hypothetical protein
MDEYRAALAILNCYLLYPLAEDPEFLPKAELERLVELAEELQNLEDGETDRSARIGIRHHAGQLFESLTRLGIIGS